MLATAKTIETIVTPQTLSVSQVSKSSVARITSLTTARAAKNSAQLRLSLSQPSSVRPGKTGPNSHLSSGLPAHQAGAEQHREADVDDRRLHLDELGIAQVERDRAEPEDEDGRDPDHRRDALEDREADARSK